MNITVTENFRYDEEIDIILKEMSRIEQVNQDTYDLELNVGKVNDLQRKFLSKISYSNELAKKKNQAIDLLKIFYSEKVVSLADYVRNEKLIDEINDIESINEILRQLREEVLEEK